MTGIATIDSLGTVYKSYARISGGRIAFDYIRFPVGYRNLWTRISRDEYMSGKKLQKSIFKKQ